MRIDVFIPDQGTYTQVLRGTLDCDTVVPSRNSHAISKSGIALHVCRALDDWCARNRLFLKQYQELPFGSKLVFNKISIKLEEMSLTVIPGHDIERRTISLKELRKLWAIDVPDGLWPEPLDIGSLQFVRQLHDTISIIQLPQSGTVQVSLAIFKSNTTSLEHLYHELRFLLTSPPHPNIMPRPMFIVTKQSRFGGEKGAVGFILPYYPQGSIRDILPLRLRSLSLSRVEQFRWAREVTSALIHVKEQSLTFYSDLRPVNVLLSSKRGPRQAVLGTDVANLQDNGESVVLCDFE